MLGTEENRIIEVSAVMSKAEALLASKISHENHGEHVSTYGGLEGLVRNDRCASRFKMETCSSIPLSKERLGGAQIRAATTEALADASGTRGNLEA